MTNIQSIFGVSSASDAFYGKIFDLYRAAPGLHSFPQGSFGPDDPLGCSGFVGLNGLGEKVACSSPFLITRANPNQDTLASGRLDWNLTDNDRAFLRLQYDQGSARFGDPISSLFDFALNQPWWQAQLLETHTFGASSANQFLLASSYFAPVFQTVNPLRALSAFPTTLNFVQGFSNLGGFDTAFVFGFGRYNTQFQVSDDVVRSQGKHKLGFGFNFERIYWSNLPPTSATIGQLSVQTLDPGWSGSSFSGF